MRQVYLIAWRGFVQHATSRAFLFGLLLLPLYMLIGGVLPGASQSQFASLGGPVRSFAVIDQTGVMLPAIDAAVERDVTARGAYFLTAYAAENADADRLRAGNPELARLLLDGDATSESTVRAIEAMGGIAQAFVALRPFLKPNAPRFEEPYRRFFRIETPSEIVDAADVAAAAKPYLSAEKLAIGSFGPVQLWAVLIVPKGFLDGSESAQYITDDTDRLGLREMLRGALDAELKRLRAAPYVPENAIDEVLGAAGTITTIDPQPDQVGALSNLRQYTVISAIIVYLMLFMAVFMTANMVVMALVEEKSNRVAELLLSCVRAETLMAGKLFTGLMLAALLVGVWAASAMFSIDTLFPGAKVIVENLIENLGNVPKALQLFVFFALAYLTIGAFFLAAGSAATSITDAQAIVAPATMVTMPVFMLPIAVAYDPASGLARVASYLPVFAPFTMMVRSLSAPDGIDVLGALVVSVLTLWVMIRMVARVFRANLLRPDSSVSFLGFLRDLVRAPRRI
jgi:ABC-2 type transport system permease protein